ncbi:MAG: metallophosphoesterase [Betaproteobacteria bacterium]|nr:metallophosphoesterase [Betaproteobacteria bacterium]
MTILLRWFRSSLLAALAAIPGTGFAAEPEGAKPFTFVAMGDLPYTEQEERLLPGMIEEIGRQDVVFVLHVGDIKNGHSVCSDRLFASRKEMFDASRHPFIYVPGDNEWTDCHRADNGSYDPPERLGKLRELFFQGESSLGGRKLRLTRQSEDPEFKPYRENVRWIHNNVVFAGLNLPGSNNNLGRSPEADAEHFARVTVNRIWIRKAFEVARAANLGAVVLFIQGNPLFELPAADKRRTGYAAFTALLAQQALAFGKPVLLIHGDTHSYRADQPLRNPITGKTMENFFRLEPYGSPTPGYIRVTVDLSARQPFRFEPVRVRLP